MHVVTSVVALVLALVAAPSRAGINSSPVWKAISPESRVRRGLLLLASDGVGAATDEAACELQAVVDFRPRTVWADVARRALTHIGRLEEPTLARLQALCPDQSRLNDKALVAAATHDFPGTLAWVLADAGDDPRLAHFEALSQLAPEGARSWLLGRVERGNDDDAWRAFDLLAREPDVARPHFDAMLARLDASGAELGAPFSLVERALHRVEPDGPRSGERIRGSALAQRWRAWLVGQAASDAAAR